LTHNDSFLIVEANLHILYPTVAAAAAATVVVAAAAAAGKHLIRFDCDLLEFLG
jgi:hypothetical protein